MLRNTKNSIILTDPLPPLYSPPCVSTKTNVDALHDPTLSPSDFTEHDSLFLRNEDDEHLCMTCLQHLCLEICIKYLFILQYIYIYIHSNEIHNVAALIVY